MCNKSNTTGVTSGAGPSGAPKSTPVFSGVRVTRSLVLYVCFVDRSLSLCTFSFGHCVICSCSIYGFWLPLWYLQTVLEPSYQHLEISTNRTSFPCWNRSGHNNTDLRTKRHIKGRHKKLEIRATRTPPNTRGWTRVLATHSNLTYVYSCSYYKRKDSADFFKSKVTNNHIQWLVAWKQSNRPRY